MNRNDGKGWVQMFVSALGLFRNYGRSSKKAASMDFWLRVRFSRLRIIMGI